jgi:hypothetical protein
VDIYLKWFQMLVASSFATVAGLIFIVRPAANVTTLFWLGSVGLILFTAMLIAHQSRKVRILHEDEGATESDSSDAIVPAPQQIGFVTRSYEDRREAVMKRMGSSEPQSIKRDDMQKHLQSLLQDLRHQRALIQRSLKR